MAGLPARLRETSISTAISILAKKEWKEESCGWGIVYSFTYFSTLVRARQNSAYLLNLSTMINSNYKSNEEENIPFGIHPSKDHSHSLAPCAPAFLVGATGRRRRVPKKEGQQPLYSPPLGHPRDPPLGYPPRPRPPSGTHPALCRATRGLRRAPVRPPSGTRTPSVGHPSGCPSALLAHWVSRASPSGHSVGPLRPGYYL
jgi:hypothetical protein